MANTNGEITHQHLLQVACEEASLEEKHAEAQQKNKRIASIDIFRGFTVAVNLSPSLPHPHHNMVNLIHAQPL